MDRLTPATPVNMLEKLKSLARNTLDTIEGSPNNYYIRFHDQHGAHQVAVVILCVQQDQHGDWTMQVASSCALPTNNWANYAEAVERALSVLRRSGLKDFRS